MEDINIWLVGGGLAVGAIFAIVIQQLRFCLVAGTSNLLLIKDSRQAVAFAVTLLVGITGTQLLEMMDVVAIADSSYRNETLDWFGASVGGLIFGIGATIAGGCSVRTLIRTMEGSIHALLALLSFALVAAVIQFGFLETPRVNLTIATSISVNDAGIASLLSISPWIVLAVVVAALLLFIIKNSKNGLDKQMIAAGLIIGSLIIASWYITGVLAQDEFDPTKPSGITVSGPLARLGYIFISGRIPGLSYAISFVIGIAIVSFIYAIVRGRFSVTMPAKGMAKMAIIGGSLMGIGSIMAYGCNIGQGLTGISTLSMESLLAVIGMVVGISITTKMMEKTV